MPRAFRILPPQTYLRECFDYNPETGVLRWRERPLHHFRQEWEWRGWNRRNAGTVIDAPGRGGYVSVGIDYNRFAAHRVIYKWMTGDEPPVLVDHRDRNRTNNRWGNLRAADRTQSNQNRVFKKKPGTYMGAHKGKKGRWRCRLKVNGRLLSLGSFDTAEEANAAYLAGVKRYFGDFGADHEK
jgi:hypothetical protein